MWAGPARHIVDELSNVNRARRQFRLWKHKYKLFLKRENRRGRENGELAKLLRIALCEEHKAQARLNRREQELREELQLFAA